ncbi:hypothetical protein CC1G_10897 [Coprinopsis cinerea okayama7|uniref:Uncharacterized protein n=1 Tax=Coprinopsis cinerea (strain Okayama-7 / 130 / ATCC MYA-4618 / FGSC 9003) TaxID=240176 RepID=A8P5W0_COPC7|nr:hypothetical protein CC1G_10897 [Coprinopsis cinerea okayama7\|eukprot:XP_001839034.2 hypothetical protein CC1G_10897 [Coprinopsis cinerea okayama7\
MAPDLDPPNNNQSTNSKWHSIRPWNAQLSLYTREITSVSATFILTTEPSGGVVEIGGGTATPVATPYPPDRHRQLEDEEQASTTSAIVHSTSKSNKKPTSLLADILSKGLQVRVNGVHWQRVLIRIGENGDEGVVIVYGLMPGREYDVDLAIPQSQSQAQERQVAGGGQPTQQGGAATVIRRHVLTADENSDPDSTGETSTDPDEHSTSSGSDPPQTLSTPSTSPSRTIPNTPPATPPPSTSTPAAISLEERLAQLRHSLAMVNAEKDGLLASIKSARKDSQKADAAVKAEIDALKRASEKYAVAEVRARQKVLALQEAVKRAQAATREIESEVGEVESEIPGLEKVRKGKEEEYEKIKKEAERVGKKREEEMEKERRRHEGMKAELAALTNKLEKLMAKKEKVEAGAIPDAEKKLREVMNEVEEEERILERVEWEVMIVQQQQQQQQQQSERERIQQQQQHSPTQHFHPRMAYEPGYLPPQRTRHTSLNGATSTTNASTNGPGPISRPSLPAPIQRPNFTSPNFASSERSNYTEMGTGTRSMNHSTSLSHSSASSTSTNPFVSNSSIWTSPARSQPNLHYGHHQHQQASQGQHSKQSQQTVPVILTNPARRGSLGALNVLPSSGSTSSFGGSSSVTSNVPPLSPLQSKNQGSPSAAPVASSSTLSSRAPAFEPGKGLGLKILTGAGGSGSGGGQGGRSGNGGKGQSPTRGTSGAVGVIGAGRR